MNAGVTLTRTYLELCGYFVALELPVHARRHGHPTDITDIDVIAVRFPSVIVEPGGLFAVPDPALAVPDQRIDVIIGEVKEGRARLNPGLRRAVSVRSALQRVGCCPPSELDAVAQRLAHAPQHALDMEHEAVRYHVRVMVFAGRGDLSGQGIQTIPLASCASFVQDHLHRYREELQGVQFHDPTLGLLHLLDRTRRHSEDL